MTLAFAVISLYRSNVKVVQSLISHICPLIPDAVEILCVSFVLPSAECELQLTSGDKGVLTAVIFLGMMFGGYLWGSLGDSMGRKYTLITSLLINSLGEQT